MACSPALVLMLLYVSNCDIEYSPLFKSKAREHEVPLDLLYAIAMTESGYSKNGVDRQPWPWALNISGVEFHLASKQEAVARLERELNSGNQNVDVGLMQTRWRFHKKNLRSAEQALDPEHNLDVGLKFLKQCFRRTQNWVLATGCYHAPSNRTRGRNYAKLVWESLRPDATVSARCHRMLRTTRE